MTEVIFLCFHYLKREDEYHRIYGYDFERFKQYIEFLQENYPIISFGDFKKSLEGKNNLPPKCSVISFDDGLAEHTNVIAPYLSERNISALFCFPTCILRGEITGIQIVHFMTARYGIRNFFEFLKKYFYVSGLEWYDYFDDNEDNLKLFPLYYKIKNVIMKKISGDKAYKVLLTIYQEILLKDDPEIFNKIYLNEKELLNLIESGHELGGHTDTHQSFIDLDIDNKEIWEKEIIKPKQILSKYLGKDVDIFAYPFGGNSNHFNFDKWTNKLKDSGFNFALNAYRDEAKKEKFNPFWIERYSVPSKSEVKGIDTNSNHYII